MVVVARSLFRCCLASLSLSVLRVGGSAEPGSAGRSAAAACAASEASSGLGLLQLDVARAGSAVRPGTRDLVLQHVPYNFGHTVEKIAAVGGGLHNMQKYVTLQGLESLEGVPKEVMWGTVNMLKRPNAEIWGHLNPDLSVRSNVTGCPMFFTPGKYWPEDLAQRYFGDRTIFGMLRDPYERLVAMFRGNLGDYGGSYPEFFATCDVNGAVKKMMRDHLSGDIYAGECTFVPQAEYFDAPFGIALAVDNRRFPDSLNEVFAQHGYADFAIAKEDILHVTGCPDVWAGDLDCEAKALVKQVYARDFELLCQKFGYCDDSENTCIEGVPGMCPSRLEEKRRSATKC
mmetsp:Transcript_93312/g.260900  ORF Transcript_93312/g.260900 Transcript_93312/m.260900 type:complete len:344 (-) Transcript_93312:72-1103(-)